MNQIFYDCSKLSLKDKTLILNKSKDLSFRWWTDVLVGCQREKVEMSWDEIIKKMKSSDHFVIIQRSFPDFITGQHYGELGFSTSDNYFLFVLVEISLFEKFVTDLKLTQM